MVGLVHGGRRVHNIYGFGATSRDGRAVFVAAFGLGAGLFASSRIFVDIDALGYLLFDGRNDLAVFDTAYITQLRIPVGVNIARGFALFVSPTLNVSFAEREGNPLAYPSRLPAQRLGERVPDVTVALWPGFALGLRFL
jgi:hypothetical protein